ncbi:MAG: formylglycine-generating enzyme family protein [Pirellulaceae bacterium]|nr:formylglycine-generating enzyme family protein [Pirellulaceae bacterium]
MRLPIYVVLSSFYAKELKTWIVALCCLLSLSVTTIVNGQEDAVVAKPTATDCNNPDSKELVSKIRQKILENSQSMTESTMQSYERQIPKAGVAFSMVAIPKGTFLMGSPEGESDRNEDEGPQIKKAIDAFWMGKCEVTWDEFEPFQLTQEGRNKDGSRKAWQMTDDPVDQISQPTPPYQPMDFGMGRKGFPAICMTHHAANKYCQWLSAQTGHFYRLPTEAEWEYAARAGTETAYYWGDDPAQIDQFAWYYENSNTYQYSQVGKKNPNPWGLHDMLGNVREWCLDQYYDDTYQNWSDDPKIGITGSKWVHSKTPYPHVARGGSYDDDAKDCRSAARMASDPTWKQQDPQLPKSIWYLTDATWLGFRIVRPLAIPSVDEMYDAWNNGVANE